MSRLPFQGLAHLICNTGGGEPVGLQHGLRLAGAAEFVVNAMAQHRHRAVLRKEFRHSVFWLSVLRSIFINK